MNSAGHRRPVATSAPRWCPMLLRPATRSAPRSLLLRPRPLARAPGLESCARTRAGSSPSISRVSTRVIDLVAISNDPRGELFQQATSRSTTRPASVPPGSPRRRARDATSCPPPAASTASRTPARSPTRTRPRTRSPPTRGQPRAEHDVLPLATRVSAPWCCVRPPCYGLSPRMRFDLAINGMTYGAWKTGKLPLMRDGTQWRPMVHVKRHRAPRKCSC